jgi:hypothetical protein
MMTTDHLIENQHSLIEMLSSRLDQTMRLLSVAVADNVELRANLEEARQELRRRDAVAAARAVPYALTPRVAEDYRIPKAGCRCGACEAARGRGETDHE